MTNLPEAEIVRKRLEKEVVGKRFKDVNIKSAGTVGRHRNRPEFVQRVEGRKIEAVSRHGTQIALLLDDETSLVVTLGAEGFLSRETANATAGPQTQAVLTFTTGGALHLVDGAKEAELFVVETERLDGYRAGGIDPLAGAFTWQAFGRHLMERRQELQTLLRDESFVVGLGDVYADEILWAAGIAGHRLSSSLSSQEIRRLYRALFEVLYEAIKQGGAAEEGDTVASDGDASTSESASYLNVYGRAAQPCPRCRRSITAESLGGGVTVFHCTSCQT